MITKETFWGGHAYKNVGQVEDIYSGKTRLWCVIGSPPAGRVRVHNVGETMIQTGPNHFFIHNPSVSQPMGVVDRDENSIGNIPSLQGAKIHFGYDATGSLAWIFDSVTEIGDKNNLVDNNPATFWRDTRLNNNSLLAMVPLDMASGPAVDTTGTFVFTAQGATIEYQVPGVVANLAGAVELKGNGDVFVSNNFSPFTDVFTLSVWLKRTDLSQPALIDWQRPFAGQILSWIAEAGAQKIEVDGILISRSQLPSWFTFDPFEWNHYVLVRRVDGFFDHYINGELINKEVEVVDPFSFVDCSMYIGSAKPSTTEGQLQQLAIFPNVLTHDEIRILWGFGRGKSYHP